MEQQLPTAILVSAQIRRAAAEGISIMVLRKGDPTSGAILLKVNLLNGRAMIYSQTWMDESRVWISHGDPLDERESDQNAFEEAIFDPDIWLIEIEDKQGRLWFPGKVINH